MEKIRESEDVTSFTFGARDGGPNAEFYLCGPTHFMADIQMGLMARGVGPEHIHTETFGPVG